MDNQPEKSEDLGNSIIKEKTVHIPFPQEFIYANCAAFGVSQMEIRIGFAEAMQNGSAVSKVGVVLPPEAAAVIAMVLFQQVRIFEENFGEIRHPAWKAMKEGKDVSPKSPLAAG